MLPLTRFFTMIGPCLGTVLPSETHPFLGLHGGCVARTERNAMDWQNGTEVNGKQKGTERNWKRFYCTTRLAHSCLLITKATVWLH